MAPVHSRYMIVETAISTVINVLISAVVMHLIFGGLRYIGLWGLHGLAIDFIPQTFMIAAMSVVIPTTLTRRRVKAGLVRPMAFHKLPASLRSLWIRALLISAGLTVAAGGAATLLLSVFWGDPVAFLTAFWFKLLYGAAIAVIATPVGLIMALSEIPNPSS